MAKRSDLHAGVTRDALLGAKREYVERLLIWAQKRDRVAYVLYRSWLP